VPAAGSQGLAGDEGDGPDSEVGEGFHGGE
jgi:hypothetical protein